MGSGFSGVGCRVWVVWLGNGGFDSNEKGVVRGEFPIVRSTFPVGLVVEKEEGTILTPSSLSRCHWCCPLPCWRQTR